MAETIANVLTGVATLAVDAPDGNRAEWSAVQAQTGTHSVKLSKVGTGNAGSTSVQITASGNAAAQTITLFEGMGGGASEWGWWHFREIIAAGSTYWTQMELRFEDPLSTSWVDITVQVDVAGAGTGMWVRRDLTNADLCGFGGWSELDGSFSNWVPAAISTVTGAGQLTAALPAGCSLQDVASPVGTWLLTRAKLELWESNHARYVYLDSIIIDFITYTFEPGDATTAGILLSAPYTEVGYTEDGVDMTYTADETDIEVEEETYPIDRVIIKETTEVTCNMAESSLYNIDKAMAGSLLSGSILKLGAGTNKKITLRLNGINPAGFTRSILIPSCTATGAVGMPYKKGEKTVVPVTFQALKTTGHPAVTIVDNAL